MRFTHHGWLLEPIVRGPRYARYTLKRRGVDVEITMNRGGSQAGRRNREATDGESTTLADGWDVNASSTSLGPVESQGTFF